VRYLFEALELLFPDGTTKSLTGALSGAVTTQVTVSKTLASGDLTGAQGIVRYYAVVTLGTGERIVSKPRFLRVRDEQDV